MLASLSTCSRSAGSLPHTLLVLAVVAAWGAASCAGSGLSQAGDAGSPDAGGVDASTPTSPDAGTPETLSGKILFRASSEGFVGLRAELYRTPVATPKPITYGDGHCDVDFSHTGDSIDDTSIVFRTPAPDDLDLGPSLTATDGTDTFRAPVETLNGGLQYSGVLMLAQPFDTTWTLTNSGSEKGLAAGTLALLHVPGRVEVQVPAPIVGSLSTESGHVTLRYSGGEGATTFHVNMLGTKATVDCYPAPGSTSFELPPEIFSALDRGITPRIWAESIRYVTVDGKTVMVRVSSDTLD